MPFRSSLELHPTELVRPPSICVRSLDLLLSELHCISFPIIIVL